MFRKMRGRNFFGMAEMKWERLMISVSFENAGEVEEYCALVYFSPETVFDGFFRGFECCNFL